MDESKLTKIFIGMIVLGVGLLIYSQSSRFIDKPIAPESAAPSQLDRLEKLASKSSNTNTNNSQKNEAALKSKVSEKKIDSENSSVPKKSHEEKMRENTEKVKKAFKSKVSAKMEFPPELEFISIDLDDGVESIYGFNHANGLGLTVMAVPKDVKNEEVLPYLDQSQGYIENTKNNPVSKIGTPIKLPKPKDSTNLKDATLWSGKLQNGDDVHIVMLRRGDDKGSYFYLYSGPNDYFSSNEDYFESLLNNFKALPANTNQ